MCGGQALKHEIRTCEKNGDPYILNMRLVLLTARGQGNSRQECSSGKLGRQAQEEPSKVHTISSAFSQLSLAVNDASTYDTPFLVSHEQHAEAGLFDWESELYDKRLWLWDRSGGGQTLLPLPIGR